MPALLVLALLPGCALKLPDVRAPELDAVPFHPQERYQCGPAALLTVLEHSGVTTEMQTLVDRVYLPAARGSLQVEMLAAARRAGRIPWRVEGGLAALATELNAGRPVLVMQNLGVGWWPRWHYAVVIGLDEDRVVLRSGTERRRLTPVSTFVRTWRRSGEWAVVALRPDEFPATLDRDRWFRALVAVEAAGQTELAAAAWASAVRRWPDAAVARFGHANSLFALGRLDEAEAGFRELLAERPGLAAARNNLAEVLLEQGRLAEAEAEAERALRDAGEDPALAGEIRDTLARVRAARGTAQSSRFGRPSRTSR